MKTDREIRNVKKSKSPLKGKRLGSIKTLGIPDNHNETLVQVA